MHENYFPCFTVPLFCIALKPPYEYRSGQVSLTHVLKIIRIRSIEQLYVNDALPEPILVLAPLKVNQGAMS